MAAKSPISLNTFIPCYEAGPQKPPLPWFQSHVSDDGWGYSELDELTLEKLSDHKYHASLKFGRYQADGTLIGNYKSLYIVIFKDGRWGITGGSGSG